MRESNYLVNEFESLSATSGIGSELVSETDESGSDDDYDLHQLKLLVEVTTGKRIHSVGPKRAKTFHCLDSVKSERSKRKKKHAKSSEFKKLKGKDSNDTKPKGDKKAARVSAKFKEVTIKSADAAGRKTSH